ncbi:Lysine-specific demethylase-like domain [Babesia duncani]|uniref:Lysine-specific demethylase-like domain n=1 Tax=Babesia duncani TaxID=323732 RepID=A0AAD9PL68_9APIC|nr:Lysine-specific demethylase-like domain [Babesia duncani]
MDERSNNYGPTSFTSEGTSVKVDLFSRQANVDPIYKRPRCSTEAQYTKVYGVCGDANNGYSPEVQEFISILKLHQTPFNSLSPEHLFNTQYSMGLNPQGAASLENNNNPEDNLHAHSTFVGAWVESFSRLLPILTTTSDDLYPSNYPVPLDAMDIPCGNSKESPIVPEDYIRGISSVLSSFTTHLDDWKRRVMDALEAEAPLDEARDLMREFDTFALGMVQVDIARELKMEIDLCERLAQDVRDQVPLLFSDDTSENAQISVEMLECLLNAAFRPRLTIPEVVKLKIAVANVSSLCHLVQDTLMDGNYSECESLLCETDSCWIKISNMRALKEHMDTRAWVIDAKRCISRSSKYTTVRDLLEMVPQTLVDHEIYHELLQRFKRAQEWLVQLQEPHFGVLLQQCGDDTLELGSAKPVNTGPCDVAAFERLCLDYGNLELCLVIYTRYIDPIYTFYKRLQKRIQKTRTMLEDENTSGLSLTDCLVLLQHADPIAKVLDLGTILDPLRTRVQECLEFDKRCRRTIDKYKARCVRIETLKLKEKLGNFRHFRRRAQISASDVKLTIELLEQRSSDMQDLEPLDFDVVEGLLIEFDSLRVKNWVIHRELCDMRDSGASVQRNLERALNNAKTEPITDANLSHLICISQDVLRFGADFNLKSLVHALGYYLWASEFYPLLYNIPEDGEIPENAIEMAKMALESDFDLFMHKPLGLENIPQKIMGSLESPNEIDLIKFIASYK